jgi:linoleate 10R-lipoxygenase
MLIRCNTAYANFEEWNPDTEIASAAEKLYGNIENLELYVGTRLEALRLYCF